MLIWDLLITSNYNFLYVKNYFPKILIYSQSKDYTRGAKLKISKLLR